MRMPNYPRGVPSQFKTHVHPWPTRYHGPIYTRPVFGLPYVQSPQAVFKPNDFSAYYAARGVSGLGAELMPGSTPASPLPSAMSERKQGMFAGFFIGLVTGAVVALVMPKRKL